MLWSFRYNLQRIYHAHPICNQCQLKYADISTSIQQLPKQHQPAARKDVDALIQRWTDLSVAAGLG